MKIQTVMEIKETKTMGTVREIKAMVMAMEQVTEVKNK